LKRGEKLKLEDMSKQELIDLVKSYEAKKKYGLVWESEHSKEILVQDPHRYFPILTENVSKRIFENPEQNSHFLLEGENYHALSVLQYTHLNSVDVIYIDPPYNTGNKDFKYNDSFVQKEDSYRHSKWLNFISKRLRLSKSLLKNDGIIFISVDDNEIAQLRLLCDDIFGETNFLACFIWEKKRKASNLDATVRGITEYILAYGRSQARSIVHPLDIVEEDKPYPFYNSGNSRGVLEFPPGLTFSSLEDGIYSPAEYKAKRTLVKLLDKVTIENSINKKSFKLEGEWRYSQKWLDNAILKNEEIVFKGTDFKPYWINRDPNRSKKMKTLLNYENYQIGTNEDGNEELFALVGENDFSFPKPTSLIKALISATTNSKDKCVVLDFFAGSGTTGDAVLQLNLEDRGNRQFILVTNNEGEICTAITFPRLQKLLKSSKGNMNYFSVDFLKNSLNSDEMKIRIMDNCVDLLCFKEGIFSEIETLNDNYKIYQNTDRLLGIYNSFDYSDLHKFKNQLDKLDGKKKVYIFTFDNEGLNPNDLLDWNDIEIESIPQKILEVIGEINAY